MTDANVTFSPTGPPETVLEPPPAEVAAALSAALALPPAQQRAAVGDVAIRWPRTLEAWASLGDLGRDQAERYACYRVGYHRGLDALRAGGWRGTGYVRWAHESNRGFLRCLQGLGAVAAEIGEVDEAVRCKQLLAQLDPSHG